MYYLCIVYVLCMYCLKTLSGGSHEVLYSQAGEGHIQGKGKTNLK